MTDNDLVRIDMRANITPQDLAKLRRQARELREAEVTLLRREVKKLREAARWIPVTERMPEKNIEVMVFLEKRYGKERITHAALNDSFGGVMWWGGYGQEEIEDFDVICWQPMPELPEVTK